MLMEMVHNYLKGTFIVTEIIEKNKDPSYHQIEVLYSRYMNDVEIVTYITDKTQFVKNYIDIDTINQYSRIISNYIDWSSPRKATITKVRCKPLVYDKISDGDYEGQLLHVQDVDKYYIWNSIRNEWVELQ